MSKLSRMSGLKSGLGESLARRFIAALAVMALLAAPALASDLVRAGQSDSIEFDRVWSAILDEAGLDAEIVSAPHERKRGMFVRGDIVLDCCSIPAWRQRPEEKASQLFSDAFFRSTEHYVFRRGHAVAPVENALKLRFVRVKGFVYDLEAPFGTAIEVHDIEEVLDHVASGEADVAIVNRQDFERRMRLKPRPLVLGPVHTVADLRVRVHRSRADLLPRINRAIAALKDAGRIEDILKETDVEKAGKGEYAGVLMVGRSDTIGTQRMWREILAEAGIKAVFVNAPQARKRRMFASGRVLLDCCAAPIWRMRDEEVAVQSWSDVFYMSREVWVFRKGEAVPVATPEDRSRLRVAAVQGFDFHDQESFGIRVPGQDIDDTLRLLAAGRADAAILGSLDYEVRIGKDSDVFERGPVRVEVGLSVRAHRNAAHLLPRINEAIARLKAEGRIEEIVQEVAAESRSPFKK
ncbi:substrate-binding periplasmic protein [Kordiimonas lipolytica]|uniref:Substrate-binding periplasmic protein n=1 Tax=Kordiimonas lipolytica TaxID=1662421 RepID=A0ABV8UEU9_9PROT|nr:transporter substrate-binding domain-containing protein [Kordiimonas lipolytica]